VVRAVSDVGAGKLDGTPPPDYASEFIFLGDGGDVVVDTLVPGFDVAVQAYFDAGLGLNIVLMELTAVALGLDRGHFRAAYGEPAPASWLNRLRLAYYPSQLDRPAVAGQLRYGAHTDWQGYTLLWQDHNVSGPQCAEVTNPPSGGLQVEIAEIPETVAMATASPALAAMAANRSKPTPHDHVSGGASAGDVDAGSSVEGRQHRCGGAYSAHSASAGDDDRGSASGYGDLEPAARHDDAIMSKQRRFVDCRPVARGFTVNAGDLIEVWTNGVFRSCVHRVANPTRGVAADARLSLVMFTGPTPDTLYGDFDIILVHFSRGSQLRPTSHVPCATLYLVPILFGC